jgi:hypothetical protein
MNRKAGSSISRDKSAAKWASREKQYDPSHVDFAMRPSGEFPIVCVSKRFFSVTINQLRDGADFRPFGRKCDSKHFPVLT